VKNISDKSSRENTYFMPNACYLEPAPFTG